VGSPTNITTLGSGTSVLLSGTGSNFGTGAVLGGFDGVLTTINSGATLTVMGTRSFTPGTPPLASGPTLNVSGLLQGTGTINGNVNILSGGGIRPGASPGIMNTGSQTWNSSGFYNWQILDATGAAGTGFSQIDITGTLDLASATGFHFNLWSLSQISPD